MTVQSEYVTEVPWVKSARDGEYFRTISRHLVRVIFERFHDIVVELSVVDMYCVGRKQITPSTVHTLSKMFGEISVLRYLRRLDRVFRG